MLSYDTINFHLPINGFENIENAPITQKLSNRRYVKNSEKETIKITGNINNYRVMINPFGIYFYGSISKYFLGNNVEPLSISNTSKAFEMMAEELNLPIKNAIVSRIDIADNIRMDYSPEIYLKYFGESNYFKRLLQPNSLYYTNGRKIKVFYNKIKEMKDKKNNMPSDWNDLYILRFEMRFLKNLSNEFKIQNINIATLLSDTFLKKISEKWIEGYKSIDKIANSDIDFSNIKTPKDFWRQIKASSINELGYEKIMQYVDTLKLLNTFKNPESYSRLKREIRALNKENSKTTKNEFIKELDEKIETSKKIFEQNLANIQ
jgi:hypothetical protein